VLEVKTEDNAEVGVPVLADVNEPTPIPTVGAALSNTTDTTVNRLAPLDLTAVPVTRLPAPRPVELPTPHDIIPVPSPPDSTHSSYHSSFEVDLESGRSQRVREVSQGNTNLISPAKRSITPPRTLPGDMAMVPVSSSPPPVSFPQEVQGSSPTINLPDLLTDSAPVMDTKPIDSSSPTSVHSEHSVPRLEATADAVSGIPSQEHGAEPAMAEPVVGRDVFDSDATVRLVGGGGTAGIAPAVEEDVHRTDDTDVASISSVTSEYEAPKGQKRHKKTKSGLAGLKKLGHLSGLRKKDSKHSINVPVSPPPTAV